MAGFVFSDDSALNDDHVETLLAEGFRHVEELP